MHHFLILVLFICSFNSAASLIRTEKCEKAVSSEFVYSDDFSWGMSIEEIKVKEEQIYLSGKRLKERAYTKDGKVFFPMDKNQEVEISMMFLEALVKQVENAFAQKYVDALIFPDMGHSHFFIPMDVYENDLKPIKDRRLRNEKMYNLPGLKVLYHTAEQLKMVDEHNNVLNDQKLIWRYQTRNIVGDMNGSPVEVVVKKGPGFNTVHDYGEEGEYRYWGAGFNISGSKDGCFAYERDGKTFYFDISLKDLEPSSYSGGFFY